MAPKKRPNPIGVGGQYETLSGRKRSVDTKVIQGEVAEDLHAECKRVVEAHGYTMREMVEWGAREFLRQFGQGMTSD